MLASRALALDPPAGPVRSGRRTEGLAERMAVHAFIRSIGPALETAFGLEPAALFPEAITNLIAAMETGPLGPVAQAVRPLEIA